MEIDRWDIESWAASSRMGEVCGIFGCPETPVVECPHCGNHYCQEHSFVINTPGHHRRKKKKLTGGTGDAKDRD